jgi:hypothetical protein
LTVGLQERYLLPVRHRWSAAGLWRARIALIVCVVFSIAVSAGCTLYQVPPPNPSTDSAIAKANQACGPTAGEIAGRLAAAPVLVPMDMLGLVEPGFPLPQNSTVSTPECQQASAVATQSVQADNQTACAQYAQAMLQKYPTDQWQYVSCECRSFTADRRFVSPSAASNYAHALVPGEFVDASFTIAGQPGLQVDVTCQHRSDVLRVIPPFSRRFPNYGCAKPLDFAICK